jgi:hypothetical protein
MIIKVSGEVNWEARIEKAEEKLVPDLKKFFKDKAYSAYLHSIGIIIVCRDKSLNLTQRKRYDKKSETFYVDIMLDLDLMKQSDEVSKEIYYIESLRQMLPFLRNLQKRTLKDFDYERFEKDLNEWISQYI